MVRNDIAKLLPVEAAKYEMTLNFFLSLLYAMNDEVNGVSVQKDGSLGPSSVESLCRCFQAGVAIAVDCRHLPLRDSLDLHTTTQAMRAQLETDEPVCNDPRARAVVSQAIVFADYLGREALSGRTWT